MSLGYVGETNALLLHKYPFGRGRLPENFAKWYLDDGRRLIVVVMVRWGGQLFF